MIKFDFNSMVNNFVDDKEYLKLLDRKDEVYNKFDNDYMTGWTKDIDINLIREIKELVQEVKMNSDCLVVIGIGGSFLGSYAVNQMFKSYFGKKNEFEVIYGGVTLSSKHLKELTEYLEDKDFTLNIISKSGTTMETMIAYKVLLELMKKKYTEEELSKRIIVHTDPVKGKFRKIVEEKGYRSFEILDDIGGRYSIMTPSHLFPLAFNIDIDEFIDGYYLGENLREAAYRYAVSRVALSKVGKVVENYVVYEENMYYFTEWLKQLYGETEGKEGKGIFPVSTVETRDLHSLGQFIQEGRKIIFETYLKVNKSDKVLYEGNDLHDINNVVLDSVRKAHLKGDVPSMMITLEEVNERTVASLMYFFMLGAAFSGYLFDVNPFDQPGVEVYKQEVRDNLGAL